MEYYFSSPFQQYKPGIPFHILSYKISNYKRDFKSITHVWETFNHSRIKHICKHYCENTPKENLVGGKKLLEIFPLVSQFLFCCGNVIYWRCTNELECYKYISNVQMQVIIDFDTQHIKT